MDITLIVIYISSMLVLAIFLNIGGWYLTLRIINGLGRRLKFHRFIAIRHLRGAKSGFLTAIGLLAILGVSFSSCTLTTVLSVMGGFSDDLKQKIITTNAHIILDNYGSDLNGLFDEGSNDKNIKYKNWQDILKKVRALKSITGATPVVQGEVMMNARTNNNGMLLKGVDIKTYTNVSQILSKLEDGDIEYLDNPQKLFQLVRKQRVSIYGSGDDDKDKKEIENEFIPAPINPRQRVLPAVIVGRELYKSLRLYIGEEVNIISPIGDIGPTGVIPRSRPFRIGGKFFSGMYAFDEHYAYTSIEAAQKFLNKGNSISEIHISVNNPDDAKTIAKELSAVFGNNLRIRSWQELNAELFAALQLEKIVMFIFLSFAILVASFCIIATLTMLVLEKSAEISVLMTIGATSKSIQSIFKFEGMIIGIVGTFAGLLTGLILCLFLKYVGLPIDPEVWYIDKLPVNISIIEFLSVGFASLLITRLATIYPTKVAAELNPVEGLKNG